MMQLSGSRYFVSPLALSVRLRAMRCTRVFSDSLVCWG